MADHLEVRRRGVFPPVAFLIAAAPIAYAIYLLAVVVPRFERIFKDFGTKLPGSTWFVAAAILLLAGHSAAVAAQVNSRGVAVEIDAKTGAITSLTNRLINEQHQVRTIPWQLETDTRIITPAAARDTGLDERGAWFAYAQDGVTARLTYASVANADCIELTLEITNVASEAITLKRITTADFAFEPAFREVHPHHDPNLWGNLINLFLRTERAGFYIGIENPIVRHWSDGHHGGGTRVGLAFEPRWRLRPGETFRCEPMFIGAFRKEGVYLFRESEKLRQAIESGRNQPSFMSTTPQILDWGEVWAMQDFLRAIQPPVEFKHPGYYVRAVGLVGDAAHIEFESRHVESSKRFVDDVARLGHVQHIEWATEWFGVGGYSKATRDFQLERVGPGDDMPVNPHWQQVADYTRKSGLGIGVFETVVRDFAREKSEWKVLLRDGKPWMWQADQATNCWANVPYVDWRIDVTDRAIREHDLYMVAWDAALPAYWMWHGWPQRRTVCFATNHTHPPGEIEYHIFRQVSRFTAELHRRHPRVALRVACGLTPGYPWVLKHLIEYHPNVYDGETGATYWSSWNFRFLPMHKSGVILSAKNDAAFKYLLLRSLSSSDHLMLWPDTVPAALRNKEFWDKWLAWADANIAYLRTGRTLFREPWGDKLIASLPPALEGALPADRGQIHGTAHCIDGDGFVFLFNPTNETRVASFPVGRWLGLTRGEHYSLDELHPRERALGVCRRDGDAFIPVPPESAMVLTIRQSEAPGDARIGSEARDDTPVDRAFLSWDQLPRHDMISRP